MSRSLRASNLAPSTRCRQACVWTLLVLTLCRCAYAQPDAKAEYQVYTLQYKAAGDVEKILAEMLPGLGTTTHLAADPRANKILLRGPEQAQQIARQLIESIDRPSRFPAKEARGEAKPLVQAYPCPEDRKAEIAGSLRATYAGRRDVRVAVDPKAAQLLILAPAEVHAAIRRQLTSLGVEDSGPRQDVQPAQPTVAAPAARPETEVGPQEHFVRLIYSQIPQTEAMLRDLFGRRLEPLESRQSGRSDFLFVDSSGDRITLSLDRRRNGVVVYGPSPVARQFLRLIEIFDAPKQASGRTMRVMPVQHSDPAKLRRAVEAYRSGYRAGGRAGQAPRVPEDHSAPVNHNAPVNQGAAEDHGAVFRLPRPGDPYRVGRSGQSKRSGVRLVNYLFQAAAVSDVGGGGSPPPGGQPAAGRDELRGRLGELGLDVQIEALPDLDVIILRGRDRDVEAISRIIEEIERISAETEPVIDVYYLKHVGGEALVTIVQQINKDLLGGRQGRVSVTPLVKPNALLLIGWGEAVEAVKQLIRKLDRPVAAETQFRMFPLRHAPAAEAMSTVQGFFSNRTALGPNVLVTADPRTNSLIVQAAPRDMAEVELLIGRLDRGETLAVMQTRIFKLKNSLALDLGGTLQAAISAAAGGTTGQRSAVLELLTIDAEGERILKSGILIDVQITPDPRINALVVSAPAESMGLIAALIDQLDSPAAVAQIKVFGIVNGDANNLVEMLRTLLPTAAGTTAGPQLAGAEGETSLIPVRFSVDARTNSIIATGSEGDLRIIEALLLRLDAEDVQQRTNAVYRLRNAPALDVARAINDFLRSERQVQQAAPGALSPFQRIESEVVVVPEIVSNTLIISATPRFFDDIQDLVEKLDAEPAQVMIQVLIAEVALTNVDEFGVELGLQDSILFDRGLLGDLLTTTATSQQSTPAGIITATEEIIQGATNEPGYAFNNKSLGNSGSDKALSNSSKVGTQGLSHFAVGRINSDLAYGGLVLSASSQGVSVLVRALSECRRLEVLARPQIMTLDNQPAFIQVGKRVPRITGTTINEVGQVNNIELENIGLILGVTPRISPDGMVVMEIDAEKSELSFEDAVPVAISEGTPIMSPSITLTTAQTTVSAASGETIVLGGLITKSKSTIQRRVPWLADIPLLGNLFRYDSETEKRTELLIILTPHVVRNAEDMERIKQNEAARMHWCLADVAAIHGPTGLCDCGQCDICLKNVQVIYPDSNPRGVAPEATAPGGQAPSQIPPGIPEPIPPGPPLYDRMPPMPAPLQQMPDLEDSSGPFLSSNRADSLQPVLPQMPYGGRSARPIPTGYPMPPNPVAPAAHVQSPYPGGMQPPVYPTPPMQPMFSRLPNVEPNAQPSRGWPQPGAYR